MNEHRREELRKPIEERKPVRKGGPIEDGRDMAKVRNEIQKFLWERSTTKATENIQGILEKIQGLKYVADIRN